MEEASVPVVVPLPVDDGSIDINTFRVDPSEYRSVFDFLKEKCSGFVKNKGYEINMETISEVTKCIPSLSSISSPEHAARDQQAEEGVGRQRRRVSGAPIRRGQSAQSSPQLPATVPRGRIGGREGRILFLVPFRPDWPSSMNSTSSWTS